MTGSVPFAEKPLVLFCEDLKYALEQLKSIITVDDYENLSNHATEAIGETGLFCIAQVISQSSAFLPVNISSHQLPLFSSHVNDERADGPLP